MHAYPGWYPGWVPGTPGWVPGTPGWVPGTMVPQDGAKQPKLYRTPDYGYFDVGTSYRTLRTVRIRTTTYVR